jgi:hypothetical protein
MGTKSRLRLFRARAVLRSNEIHIREVRMLREALFAV